MTVTTKTPVVAKPATPPLATKLAAPLAKSAAPAANGTAVGATATPTAATTSPAAKPAAQKLPSPIQALGLGQKDAAKYVRLAGAFIHAKEYDGAEGAAEVATACDPQDFNAWVALGVARARMQHFAEALPAYLNALKLNPNDVACWTDVGELYVSLLDFQKAADALKQAMELDPKAEHPSGRRARAIVARVIGQLKKR